MICKISLEYFNTGKIHYHLYRIGNSPVSEAAHYHDYYQVCYVARGEIIHRHEDKDVHLMHGDAFIIPPNFVHSLIFSNKNSEIYSLSFKKNIFHPGFCYSNEYKFITALEPDIMGKDREESREESMAACREGNRVENWEGIREESWEESREKVRLKVRLNELQQKNMYALLECLIREFSNACPKELGLSANLISSILCILSQSYFEQREKDEKLSGINCNQDIIEQSIRFVDRNFMNPITLNDITRRFAISKSTFCMLFPKIAGAPLKQYINIKRIMYAAELTRKDSSLTFAEISKMVGYDDFSTFYRNFTKIIGVTPSQFKAESL